jgi:hypothetical protein
VLRRHREKVNFHIQRNETDRLEKNGIDSDAATDCIERYKKKKKKGEKGEEKRTSVQYSITQIDTDKAIGEALLFSSSSSSLLRSYRTNETEFE